MVSHWMEVLLQHLMRWKMVVIEIKRREEDGSDELRRVYHLERQGKDDKMTIFENQR